MNLAKTGMALVVPFVALAAHAAEPRMPDTGRPAIFQTLIDCRSIQNAEERLSCYDKNVAAMDEAEKNKEIVLADRESMKEARRGLFGFSLPKLKLFGDGSDDATELESTIASVYQSPNGRWNIKLPDGAHWLQLGSDSINRYPKAGMSIMIKPAAMGSFFASIDGQRSIRMKRVN